ncbi:ImcF-related family protein [Pseudomonas sp. TE3610]
MHIPRSTGALTLVSTLLVIVMTATAVLWYFPQWLDSEQGVERWLMLAAIGTVLVLLATSCKLFGDKQGRSVLAEMAADDHIRLPRPLVAPPSTAAHDARAYLREHYGWRWRGKVRLILVLGEAEQVNAVAPGLAVDEWQECSGTLLLWAGSCAGMAPQAVAGQLKALHRRRPFDAIVWPLTQGQRGDDKAMGNGARHLRDLTHALRWQAPLYLWQVCSSGWSQAGREVASVGCLLPAPTRDADVAAALTALVAPLNQQGIEQMRLDSRHDFLYRLGGDLHAVGIEQWCKTLAPLLPAFARGAPLRGLQFSLARDDDAAPRVGHLLQLDPAWAQVLEDRVAGKRAGWHAVRLASVGFMMAALVMLAGVVIAFSSNRNLLEQANTALTQPGTDLQRLVAITRQLDRQGVRGAPWYQGLALNPAPQLRQALWPRYEQLALPLLRDAAMLQLQSRLRTALALQPGSDTQPAHEALKAYLMMANPARVEPGFLAQKMAQFQAPPGVGPEEWGTYASTLWQFYAEQLPRHPQWAIAADANLTVRTRQLLLAELERRNSETALYTQVLEQAGRFPALSMAQMAGSTALFDSASAVPGAFTRQAWEGQVRDAIEQTAQARREAVDWVLGEPPANHADRVSADALQARLTARYFRDFGKAWLRALNAVSWRSVSTLPEAVEQLALAGDASQSPLLALQQTLAYQGQTDPQRLATVFGPLVKLADSELPGYLSAITSARLALQQSANARDPQSQAQAMAQSVLQGQASGLSQAHEQGRLLAANLGRQWQGLGQALFVEPLEQARQLLLQPSAGGLNRQWQQTIVAHWNAAFGGRYPFAATDSDVSLAMLGQMIRADTGRIEQFLRAELDGVVRKQGGRWVLNPRHPQDVRVNPQFLQAINQLSHLADVLYTDGGMGRGFDLRAKPVRDVVQTTFILDGERQHYFNQKERWQRFRWPGRGDQPGTRLTWTSVHTGERLFGEYPGPWGLIRLLEQARVTALDDSGTQFRIVLTAPDGLPLTWHLRTELGAGPLAALTLRGFTLPREVFLADDDPLAAGEDKGSTS